MQADPSLPFQHAVKTRSWSSTVTTWRQASIIPRSPLAQAAVSAQDSAGCCQVVGR